ncbi:MAG: hypothetical protein ACREWI_04615, partial [Telluria sp.]
STLRLPLPAGRRPLHLGLDGNYVDGVRESLVSINGVALGKVALGRGPLVVPPQAGQGQVLVVTIEHRLPPRPAAAGDPRALGFSLRGVYMEFAP